MNMGYRLQEQALMPEETYVDTVPFQEKPPDEYTVSVKAVYVNAASRHIIRINAPVQYQAR